MATLHDVHSAAAPAKGFGLDAQFEATLTTLIATCRQAGYDFRVSQGLRTPQVQAEYYCKWKGHPATLIDSKSKMLADKGAPWLAALLSSYRDIPRQKNKLTEQLPGSGWHQWGLAADCYCYRDGKMVEDGNDPCYEFYAQEATKLGLTAGFYFTFKDSGHVQAPSAAGATSVYTWSYIDEIMKQRFSAKPPVTGSATDAPQAPSGQAPSKDTAPAAVASFAREVAMEAAAAPTVPPPAEPGDISVRGKGVFGPGGTRFGTVLRAGMFNFGATSIGKFFEQDPDALPNISKSLQRVIQAVSENEGKIEAINTYDNSFLSCGVFQWTAGAANGAGELAGLLDLLKTRAAAAFQEYFGSLGLDVEMKSSPPNTLQYGFLVLEGQTLNTGAKKKVLRENIWAYRFWRAAHDQEVRRAQIALAMSRVGTFYPVPIPGRSQKLSDYISSEYGVALLLDEHVNRPGHVPKTLLAAVTAFVSGGGRKDPKTWTTADESKVLDLYLVKRAQTNMTDSDKRAAATLKHVESGNLSAERGSFA
jgi:hypothetical protein